MTALVILEAGFFARIRILDRKKPAGAIVLIGDLSRLVSRFAERVLRQAAQGVVDPGLEPI